MPLWSSFSEMPARHRYWVLFLLYFSISNFIVRRMIDDVRFEWTMS